MTKGTLATTTVPPSTDLQIAGVELVVDVSGVPAPQGSKTFKGFRGGKPVLVESCAAVKPWRDAVVLATTKAMQRAGFTTVFVPSIVVIDFYLVRPPSAPKLRTRPDRRPDLDKLVRSTLDALTTAGAIEDDARVVEIIARKHYAESLWTGARIRVKQAGRSARRPTTACTCARPV